MSNFIDIQELLHQKADMESRLALLPYEGTPEIKSKNNVQYIYLRKRVLGRLTSTYIDKYSDELYAFVISSCKESKELSKAIRKIDKELLALGYSPSELSPRVELNLDFARANMKSSIYDQAILEGVSTTYPDTETILENGVVSGMKPTDIQKILNLKHAWEFILNKGVIASLSDLTILSHIAKLVNEGFYESGGRIRAVPVRIGGSSYLPPIPIESKLKEELLEIISNDIEAIDTAIELCLYCMKKQIFIDGNKRAAIIFANHFLISKGEGLLVVPSNEVPTFKSLLIDYYEDKNSLKIKEFLKNKCWYNF